MTFGNTLSSSLSSISMQTFMKTFHMVQEIGPSSLFQNFDLGKAPTKDKWHLAIPWARSCQYQYVCKISSTYSTRKRQDQFHFQFFRSFTSAEPRPTVNGIWQSLVWILSISMSIRIFIKIIQLFFRILTSAKSRPFANGICQIFGLHLVSINVYANLYQNICTVQELGPVSCF